MEIMFTQLPGVTPTMEVMPYEVETDGNTTYTRFTDGMVQRYRSGQIPFGDPIQQKQLIFRQTVDGSITRNEKAFDLWENRKTATYVPVSSPLNGLKGWQ